MGQQRRAADAAVPAQAVYAHDLVVRDVDLDVADPEPQASVGGDVDASDGVVPEPGDYEEVAYGDGDDGPVRADGDGRDEDGDEDGLEEEESEFECCLWVCVETMATAHHSGRRLL